MPELPEVETICRGLRPHLLNQAIVKTEVLDAALRWPIPKDLPKKLTNLAFTNIFRRAKYLLFQTERGAVIIHLGLSGQLRILPTIHKPLLHEHLAIHFINKNALCLIDPRRFGTCLWTNEDPLTHPLLVDLGPEPLTPDFNLDFFFDVIKRKQIPIKQVLMDGRIVAGIGNIYANEALFMARIDPTKPAKKLAREEVETLVNAIKRVLTAAVAKGGTTIRDYITSDGSIGHFQQELKVYGRTGKPCPNCQKPIQEIRLAQRSTFYCPDCQK